MSEAVELLQQLGFGEYEAKAYIALLQQNPLNGYELAKASGVPRANIYGILQCLESRQAIVRIDAEGSQRYVPVPPRELIRDIAAHFQHVCEKSFAILEALAKPAPQDLSRNVVGYEPVLDQARTLINSAQDSLFMGVWYPESVALASNIAQAQVHITTLCLKPCSRECGLCAGSIYRYHIAPEQMVRWLIVVKDDQEMLMGEIGKDQTLAIRTSQSSLIQMTVQYLRSQIAWAAVLEQPNTALEQALKPDALRVLNEIRPHGAQSNWLSFMRSVLSGDV